MHPYILQEIVKVVIKHNIVTDFFYITKTLQIWGYSATAYHNCMAYLTAQHLLALNKHSSGTFTIVVL